MIEPLNPFPSNPFGLYSQHAKIDLRTQQRVEAAGARVEPVSTAARGCDVKIEVPAVRDGAAGG